MGRALVWDGRKLGIDLLRQTARSLDFALLQHTVLWFIAIALFSGCGPQLDSRDYEERIRAVEELANQEVLA